VTSVTDEELLEWHQELFARTCSGERLSADDAHRRNTMDAEIQRRGLQDEMHRYSINIWCNAAVHPLAARRWTKALRG
jgi:hypothetical protein